MSRLLPLLLPAALVALWEALAGSGLVQSNLLPGPTTVGRTLLALAQSGDLLLHATTTLWRVAVGFAAGTLAATVLGALTGYSSLWRRLLDPTVQALRNIPSIAWVPLFILWLGIFEASKVALIAVGAFFPIYLNLMSGIAAVDRKLVEVGRVHGFGGAKLVRRILLPATLPAYLTGLRGGLGLAWMFVVAAEFMGASEGLGFLLIDGQMTGRPATIIASIILFAVIGKLTDLALAGVGRHLVAWQDSFDRTPELEAAHAADRPRLQTV